MAKKQKVVSFIFPVYNNAGSLKLLCDEVKKIMSPLNYDYEFMFINDGSKDNSLDILQRLARHDKKIKVINLSRNFGHQAAVTAGLDKVGGEAIIIMDADQQDPPSVCVELIKKWEEGFDVAYAQRRSRQDTFYKKTVANVYYRVLASMSSVDIPRNTGDFRLVSKRVVDVIKEMGEHDRFLRGMFSFVGFEQVAVPFDRDQRHDGKSEYTFKKQMKLAKAGVFGFSDVPLRFVSHIGFLVSFLSIIGIIYALFVRIFIPEIAVSGWTMTIVSIFFVGGVQLSMLGVIGEYIARIYNESLNRPTYIIEKEINT
ncbi:glycosyltransferase [Candidatus Saccharibacteria bacterium RIFCSPHIGHO2_02_FULL_46_12]|nr:MAG: glycosyltransferase [Candidatus Saccharibacteria bacterium RIFCSPHIGHO2_02_FULL_46_12]